MTEIQNYKALEQAFKDGETLIMLTSERVLTACIMAERCGFDKTNISNYIGLIQSAKMNWGVRYDPDYSISMLNAEGKPYKKHISISILADAIRVILMMDKHHSRISLQKDENGNFTGIADLTRVE